MDTAWIPDNAGSSKERIYAKEHNRKEFRRDNWQKKSERTMAISRTGRRILYLQARIYFSI
jgi:hypothetical protein